MATKRRGKAKTAYELCERVCEAIEAHPFNYYQAYWRARRSHRGDMTLTTVPLPSELDVPQNECGTAFCRAGWMVELHDGPRARVRSYEQRARHLLGLPREPDILETDDVDRLFSGAAVRGTPGTKRYVSAGVRGLQRFMKKHAAHLKARKLRGV